LNGKKKYDASTILTEWKRPELCEKYFPGGFIDGLDKTGHPINVLCLGQTDLKGLVKSHPREDLIKYKCYEMERFEETMRQTTKSTGKLTETTTAIVDLFGLSSYHLWRPGLQLFNEMAQIEEMYYPEIVNKVFIINAPRIFPTIYAFVKPFIDPNTRAKLEICSSATYKERLLDFISEDILLERYGGKSKNEAPIQWAGRVPKEHYKQNDDSLTPTYIKPGRTFVIKIDVEKIGSEISWEFVTENHDIGFGVFF